MEIWRNAIYVILGRNVLEAFTEKKNFIVKFFDPEQLGSLLMPYTNALKKGLAKNDIFLPNIYYAYDSELNPDLYYVVSGTKKILYHYKQAYLFDVIEYNAKSYMLLEEPNLTTIHNLVENADASLEQGKFNKAMELYDKTFYWTLCIDNDLSDSLEVFMNATYNASYIYYINRNIDDAIRLAEILLAVVDSNAFHDPIMRYMVHMLYADLLWLNDKNDDALNYFKQCVNDVKYINRPELLRLALWDIVCAYFALSNATDNDCLLALNLFKNLAYPHEMQYVSDLIISVQGKKIDELKGENQRLRNRCEDLEKKLSWRTSIGNTLQHVKGLLITISAILPKQMAFMTTVGRLEVSKNVFKDDASVLKSL